MITDIINITLAIVLVVYIILAYHKKDKFSTIEVNMSDEDTLAMYRLLAERMQEQIYNPPSETLGSMRRLREECSCYPIASENCSCYLCRSDEDDIDTDPHREPMSQKQPKPKTAISKATTKPKKKDKK